MKVEILSRELIKPYTATPSSLRNYNISLLDELAPNMNVPTIFYYSPSDQHNGLLTCKHLKKSLSNTLTSFHPFAGRYRIDSHSVDCSDQGVEFVEAKVDVSLNDLLRQRMTLKTELLNDLLPCTVGAVDEYTDPLLAVQVSAFTCGGFAIGVSSSHRIADMFTKISFIKAWATATKQELGYIDENYKPISFNFDSALLFPGKNLPGLPTGLPRDKQNIEVHKIITKIFYFNKSKISSIRESARLGNYPNKKLPSRVQSVLGVIAKAIIDIHVANPDNPKTYLFNEAVNMRERTVPPLPKNQFGNLFLIARAEPVAGPKGVDLPSIVDILSNSVKRTVDKCGMLLSLGKDEQQTMISHEHNELIKSLLYPDIYNGGTFTSWCNFPLYEADFGWGEPSWVSVINFPMKNTVVLVDDKTGEGIEAWVSLDEIDMQKFTQQSNIADILNYN